MLSRLSITNINNQKVVGEREKAITCSRARVRERESDNMLQSEGERESAKMRDK